MAADSQLSLRFNCLDANATERGFAQETLIFL
jgi:hypothetical protein